MNLRQTARGLLLDLPFTGRLHCSADYSGSSRDHSRSKGSSIASMAEQESRRKESLHWRERLASWTDCPCKPVRGSDTWYKAKVRHRCKMLRLLHEWAGTGRRRIRCRTVCWSIYCMHRSICRCSHNGCNADYRVHLLLHSSPPDLTVMQSMKTAGQSW